MGSFNREKDFISRCDKQPSVQIKDQTGLIFLPFSLILESNRKVRFKTSIERVNFSGFYCLIEGVAYLSIIKAYNYM